MDNYKQSSSRRATIITALAIVVALIIGYHLLVQVPGEASTHVTKAVAVVSGDSPVTGSVFFEQSSPHGPVTITGKLKKLDPNALRGFHVHEKGDATNGCISAGAHFNPYNQPHGGPDDSHRHVGDLGNIQSDESGEAHFSFEDSVISLNGPRSILGRSVVIHAGTDDLGRGNNEESSRTGNAGGRAACGVIGLA